MILPENKSPQLNIPYNILQWGPCIVSLKIPINTQLLLLKEGKASKEDAIPNLAGILDKGVYFRDKSKFNKFFETIFSLYNHAVETQLRQIPKYFSERKKSGKLLEARQSDFLAPKYLLKSLWCNFQRPHDFNPPHSHGGALSFVIYLQIPEELRKENQEYRGQSSGPGSITFSYGDSEDYAICNNSFLPEERDMFVFPAWVKHWVYPYKSNCTRISVSGNVMDSIPLNQMKKR